MKVIQDIPYIENATPAQTLDLYLPDCPTFPTFIYFHGGGLVAGHKHSPFIPPLVDKGIAVATVEYRFLPDAKYPDFILDCAAAVDWVKRNISNYGNSTDLFVGGSSAGGYISMMLCFNPSFLAPYGVHPEDLSGFIHDAGQPTAHFNCLKYSGRDSRRVIVDETAPLYYIGTQENLPPMYFIWSDNDMVGRPEQLTLTLTTLAHFGYDMSKIEKTVTHGTHCWYIKGKDENGNNVLAEMVGAYINKMKKGALENG